MVTIDYDHNILKHLEQLEKLLEETEIDIEDHIKIVKLIDIENPNIIIIRAIK